MARCTVHGETRHLEANFSHTQKIIIIKNIKIKTTYRKKRCAVEEKSCNNSRSAQAERNKEKTSGKWEGMLVAQPQSNQLWGSTKLHMAPS